MPAEGVRERKAQVCQGCLEEEGCKSALEGEEPGLTSLAALERLHLLVSAGACQSGQPPAPGSGWGPCSIQAKPGGARACAWGDLPMDLSVTGDMRQEL